MIAATFETTDVQVVAMLKVLGPKIVTALSAQMDFLMIKLQAHIVTDKLEGQVLNHVSGKLIGSVITNPVELKADILTAMVTSSSGPAWYGRLHEYGGIFNAKPKVLKNPSHMVKRKNGTRAMTGSAYTITFPERSFMRSSHREMTEEIISKLNMTLKRVVEKG